MTSQTPSPADTVNRFGEALNRGDLEACVGLYEPDGVLMVQPGQWARGAAELRTALAQFVAMRPTLVSEVQHVLQRDSLALYLARWTLHGTDPTGQAIELRGVSTDVLHRQPDGRWLIAIDNPWGTELLSLSKQAA